MGARLARLARSTSMWRLILQCGLLRVHRSHQVIWRGLRIGVCGLAAGGQERGQRLSLGFRRLHLAQGKMHPWPARSDVVLGSCWGVAGCSDSLEGGVSEDEELRSSSARMTYLRSSTRCEDSDCHSESQWNLSFRDAVPEHEVCRYPVKCQSSL